MGVLGIAIIVVVLLIIGVTVSSILVPKKKVIDFETCVDALGAIMESYPRQCSFNGETFTEEQTITISIPCEKDELDCNNFVSQKVAQELYERCGGVGFDVHNLDPDENGIACEDYDYGEE